MRSRAQKKLARIVVRVADDLKERVAATAARTHCSKSDVIRAHIEAAYVHGDDVADGIVRSRYESRDVKEVL